ncbi:hypothetical protein L3Q82_021071 [Scortum barcoo]|uniref:Uncharacterized protein n=1 Tax=Scortum barcoo TaxID=214431 RepID=A0ACB8X4Y4_9TELE|nr:hypothetical protein L3Q82_021071 [Scortum barcoo]
MVRISGCSRGEEGVRFGDLRPASLLFADDVFLLTSSDCDLQQAPRHLHVYSRERSVQERGGEERAELEGKVLDFPPQRRAEELAVQPLILHIKRSRSRWFNIRIGILLGTSLWRSSVQVQHAGDLKEDPEHTGRIKYLIWTGNTSGST